MSKDESDKLIKQAQKYLGQDYVVSNGKGAIYEESEFVGTQENETNGDYKPLAVLHSKTKGDHWTTDLARIVSNYMIWNKDV